MESDNFSSRLREERTRLGLSQEALAQAGGVKKLAQHKYEKGENSPSAAYLQAIAAAGVDPAYLLTGMRSTSATGGKDRNLTGALPAPIDSDDVVFVSLMSATGSMGSGNDLVAEDVVLGDVPLSRRWLSQHLPNSRPSALRLMHAYGDSMRGTLESGDFALVDTDVQSVEIDGVYVLQAHSRLFIKRVRQRMDGCYEVSSDNPAIKQTDILNGKHEVRVCGRVVYGWNGRRF